MPYYAHTDGSQDPAKWELLGDHLKAVAFLERAMAAKFGSDEWGFLIGLWHDIGKYHPDFQKKLFGMYLSCPHAPAGAYLAYMRTEGVSLKLAYTLAQVIGGHHGGLRDKVEIDDMLNAARREDWPIVSKRMPDNIMEHAIPEFPEWLNLEDPISLDLWTRFLFSALVDADRLATENYSEPNANRRRQDSLGRQNNLPDMLAKFEQYITTKEAEAFEKGKAGSLINILRHQVSQQCLAAAYGNRGAYSCTVPTGGGKTLSIMRFALHHSMRHKMDRIIVVIPFTSIIDQNAEVYMNALGFCNVLEHHSNIDLAKKKRAAEEERKRRQEIDSPLNYFANENWDIPVVVTTNVQFFESLFSRKPSSCRKIHNIANSVIIFDEVQLFPLDYVEPIISVIKRLIEEYRCTVVFSTATQPAFSERFVKEGIKSQEIVPTPEGLAENLRRVKIHWPRSMKHTVSWEALAKRILRVGKESMTIVNLKQDALDLSLTLKAMKPGDHVFHLSAHMCPEHRREKIREIREILERNKERKRLGDNKLETCRVVTTQLIEAGVDIDFPYVFRAMVGLDSIAQAAGRCNREGLLSMGHLWVFNPETLPPPGVLRSGLAITVEMFMVHGRSLDPTNPVIQSSYFEKLYASQSLDKKDIGLKKRRRDFRQIHEDFKIISDETFVVLVPWGDKGNAMLLEVLNAVELEKRHLRAMQPYTVSVYKKVLDDLLQKGHITQLVVDDEEKIIWYVEDMSAYDKDYGLLV